MSLISMRDLNKNEVNANLLSEDFRTRTHSILLKVIHGVSLWNRKGVQNER